MPELASVPESRPLSQVARVVDTFVAPSQTFTDILRSASWWLPCVLLVIVSAVTANVMVRKVGLERITDNVIATLPAIQDQISNAKPEDAQKIRTAMSKNLNGQIYSSPVLLIVASFVASGLFLMAANFGFGGRATYKGMLAVYWYSILPLVVSSILISALLTAGVNVETFRIANPIGTNPGYYMGAGSSPVLVAFLGFFDLFSLWVFCLQAIGTSIVARISLGKAFAAVGICWVLYLIVKIAPTMIFS